MDTLLFMLAPLVASLVLLSLHAYTGLHILARGVIFVDLALAQVATLGIALAMLAEYEPNSPPAYLLAFAFTVVGALLFASMRKVPERVVPHEALIGITYVVASAAMILVLAYSPHGSENLKALLVGSILWTSWEEIGVMAAVYAVLGLLHWGLRRPFLALSRQPGGAGDHNIGWDFLFYLLFGIMLTFSVRLAGVLLVFSYLIIPGVTSAFVASRWGPRLTVAWVLGGIGSALGIAVSFWSDLPTGATIVCALGVLLVLMMAYAFGWGAVSRGPARAPGPGARLMAQGWRPRL